MAKLPLDLKGFKKSASDKHTTTLVHKNGHEIKLAHSALSEDMRKMIKALPFSKEEVREDLAAPQEPVAKRETPKQLVQSDGPNSSPQKLADGGQVKSKGQADREALSKGVNSGGDSIGKMASNIADSFNDLVSGKKMADGGEVEQAADAAKSIAKDSPDAPITINIGHPQPMPQNFINPMAGQAALQQAQAAGQPVADSAPQLQDTFGVPKEQQAQMMASAAPQAAPQPQLAAPPQAGVEQPSAQAPAADPYGMEAYQNSLGQGVAEQKAGIMAGAQAAGNQGAAESQALDQGVQAQKKQLQTFQEHYKDLEGERQAFQHDIENAHIDPKHYMSSMSTLGKISTGIGLLLGGMGSGVTGGENPALSFLNKQIDRDIDAQKMELGKKENLLSANLKQFGNMRDATEMTRVMQNDILISKLKAAAANAASPLAQAAALKAIGQIDTENAGRLQQLAVRKTMMSAMSNATQDPAQMGQVIQAMRQVSPEMAKSMEERYIPGVGLAQVPVPQSARDTIIAKQTLQQMAGDFYKWAEKHSGSIDPAIVNEGQTKAAELQSLYRNSINGGVFKKGEQEFIDQIVDSDPTKFFNKVRVLPKLREVMNSNIQQLNTLKRGYGIQTNQIQESAPVLPSRK